MKKRSKAFEKIAEGLNEALAIARGQAKPCSPNAKTIAAIKASRAGKGRKAASVTKLMKDLNAK